MFALVNSYHYAWGEGGQVGEYVRLCQTSALVYLYVSASEPWGGDRREPKERVDRVDNISGSYGFQQNISQNWPNTWQASLLIYLSPCIFGPVFVFILLPK